MTQHLTHSTAVLTYSLTELLEGLQTLTFVFLYASTLFLFFHVQFTGF